MSRSLLSMMVRRVSTSTTSSSVSASSLADRAAEQSPGLRLAPAQSARMDDLGTRNIFSPEQDMFRESVRRYMREELAPLQTQFEEAGQPTRAAWLSLGSQGLLGVNTPAEVGGVGGSFIDEMIVCEEMSYALCASPAVALHATIAMPYITHYGTREQQERYIPR